MATMAVKASGLGKIFGRTRALRGVCFDLPRGSTLGLIGPNGAGKTTLLRILATLLVPTSGSVEVLGYGMETENIDIRRRIGFLPDFFHLYSNMTLRNCLGFFASSYDLPPERISSRIGEVLDAVGLTPRADEQIRNISRGMVQRIGLAAVMVHDPEFLLLDEPASGLDPQSRATLYGIIAGFRDSGRTVIVSSHILEELAEVCTHLAIITDGALRAFGPADEVLARHGGISRVEVTAAAARVDIEKALRPLEKVELLSETREGSGTRYSLGMDTSPESIAGLNRTLVENGIPVWGLGVRTPGLLEAFRNIVSGSGKGGDSWTQ